MIDISKSLEAVLYVLNRVNPCDYHKLFKILYFADQSHLASYGRPILGDEYIAMQNGPVPSYVYDLIKVAKGEKKYMNAEIGELSKSIKPFPPHYVKAEREADLDYLSESDMEHLDKSIDGNRNLSFNELTNKSHDLAWHAAHTDGIIDFIKIAEAGGANSEMLEYINTLIYNAKHFCV